MKSLSFHDLSVYSRRDLTHVTSFSAERHCCLPTPVDVPWDYSLPSPLTPGIRRKRQVDERTDEGCAF